MRPELGYYRSVDGEASPFWIILLLVSGLINHRMIRKWEFGSSSSHVSPEHQTSNLGAGIQIPSGAQILLFCFNAGVLKTSACSHRVPISVPIACTTPTSACG